MGGESEGRGGEFYVLHQCFLEVLVLVLGLGLDLGLKWWEF